MEALVIFGTAFLSLLGLFTIVAAIDRMQDGHWWWDKPPTDKWLEAQAQAMRIQLLEHDLGMMPHSDKEMAHLCRTCERAEEMALKQKEIVAKSWEVRKWDGRWRPAAIGRNLYPDREQIEVTSFGDDEPRYVPGRLMSDLEVVSLAEDLQRQAAGIPPPLIGIKPDITWK